MVDFPFVDNKIITSWNALTILGLTKSYQAFGEENWLLEAEKTFAFLVETFCQRCSLSSISK